METPIWPNIYPASTDLTLDDIYRVNEMYGILCMAFYWATGMLSALLDNAPMYLSFFAAALGLHAFGINDSSHVAR